MKKVYVLCATDASAVAVQRHVQEKYGADVIALFHNGNSVPEARVAGCEIVYLFTAATEDYPNKYIRRMPWHQYTDSARLQAIDIPGLIRRQMEKRPGTLVALRRGLSYSKEPPYAEALRQMHFTSAGGRWIGEKKKRKSRLALHQQRKRERATAGIAAFA